ncbi:hypothetical protein Ddye_015871 [Dipteronia dyeriana]|uniref:Cupin type-1 domain-containing protein n=1 Tax=Dipteronia dyeriana TaxID=168575 RepID=A0AAD9U5T5_9ROSI|nr:hypothetical protein Ddye_015871 [Dipteronia dyeriana]
MGMRRKLCFTLLLLSVLVLSASLTLANTPQLKSCRGQCKEEFKDRQKKQCLQKCEDDYRQNRRENSYMNEINEPGSDQGQEEDENPYVFESHHFLSKVKTDHGRILSIPKFDRRSKLLRGIRRYRVAILQLNPETVFTPTHFDASCILFVSSGQGTINEIHEDRRDSFKLEKGVLFRLRAGTTFSIVNHHQREKLNIIQLLRTVNNEGQFEPFFLAAGSNPESFFTTFSSEILEAALKTSKGELQRLFSRREQGQGVFVKASKEQIRALSDREESGGIWPFRSQSRGTFRLFKQHSTQSNNFGKLYEADHDDYPPLEEENLSVSYANISRNAMVSPYYNGEATKIAVVTDGDGYFEMACPHVSKSWDGEQQQQEGRSGVTYHKIRSAIKTGSVFIVPAGHPVVMVSSNRGNLEIVCFEVNAKHNVRYMLAGKKNLVKKMEGEEKELTFDAKREVVDQVFGNQDEEFFLQGPKWRQQPGRGRAYE